MNHPRWRTRARRHPRVGSTLGEKAPPVMRAGAVSEHSEPGQKNHTQTTVQGSSSGNSVKTQVEKARAMKRSGFTFTTKDLSTWETDTSRTWEDFSYEPKAYSTDFQWIPGNGALSTSSYYVDKDAPELYNYLTNMTAMDAGYGYRLLANDLIELGGHTFFRVAEKDSGDALVKADGSPTTMVLADQVVMRFYKITGTDVQFDAGLEGGTTDPALDRIQDGTLTRVQDHYGATVYPDMETLKSTLASKDWSLIRGTRRCNEAP